MRVGVAFSSADEACIEEEPAGEEDQGAKAHVEGTVGREGDGCVGVESVAARLDERGNNERSNATRPEDDTCSSEISVAESVEPSWAGDWYQPRAKVQWTMAG